MKCEKITNKSKELVEYLMDKVCKIFQAEKAELSATKCWVKSYRGSSDYWLILDGDGEMFLQNIKNKINKTQTTELIITELNNIISRFEFLSNNIEPLWAALKEREKADNITAAEKGLKPYELIEIGLANKGRDCGRVYASLEIQGKERLHMDAGFSLDSWEGKIDSLKSGVKEFYVTAGMPGGKANYVFRNIGFNTNSERFTVPGKGITLKSAKKNTMIIYIPEMNGFVEVEAKSIEEAFKLLGMELDQDETPLPEGEYLDDPQRI